MCCDGPIVAPPGVLIRQGGKNPFISFFKKILEEIETCRRQEEEVNRCEICGDLQISERWEEIQSLKSKIEKDIKSGKISINMYKICDSCSASSLILKKEF